MAVALRTSSSVADSEVITASSASVRLQGHTFSASQTSFMIRARDAGSASVRLSRHPVGSLAVATLSRTFEGQSAAEKHGQQEECFNQLRCMFRTQDRWSVYECLSDDRRADGAFMSRSADRPVGCEGIVPPRA